VERWFGLLTERQLRRGGHRSTDELEAAIMRYVDVTNREPKPFIWTKTADQILENLARYRERISDSGHSRVEWHGEKGALPVTIAVCAANLQPCACGPGARESNGTRSLP
jgi:hypothetical protein